MDQELKAHLEAMERRIIDHAGRAFDHLELKRLTGENELSSQFFDIAEKSDKRWQASRELERRVAAVERRLDALERGKA